MKLADLLSRDDLPPDVLATIKAELQSRGAACPEAETAGADTTFEHSPVPLWDVDLSATKSMLSSTDALDAPTQYADWAGSLARSVRLLRANKAARELIGPGLWRPGQKRGEARLDDRVLPVLADALPRLLRGEGPVEVWLPTGASRDGSTRVLLQCSALPGHEGTWARCLISLSDTTAVGAAEGARAEAEQRYRRLFDASPAGVHVYELGADGRLVFLDANPAANSLLGVDCTQYRGLTIEEAFPPLADTEIPAAYRRVAATGVPWHTRHVDYADGTIGGAFEVSAFQTAPGVVAAMFVDVTERARSQEALERRLTSLTQPSQQIEDLQLDDLIDPGELQRIQDLFAVATGVASLITRPDGTPITQPGNFCRLCRDIIRKTEVGLRNCYRSDAVLGAYHPEGPVIQPCLSGGFMDAGASITVGGRHVANWLIGQVRDETQTEERMRQYAREIGADEDEVAEAFAEVDTMSKERFRAVAEALFVFANQLSATAYQNLQQARFIAELDRAHEALRESEERWQFALEGAGDGVWDWDLQTDEVLFSPQWKAMLGYGEHEIQNEFREWETRVHPDDLQQAKAELQAHLSGAKDLYISEHRLLCRDGTYKWILDRGRIVRRGSDGRPLRMVGTHTDLGDRKRAEDAQRLASVGQLASGVAHEFNNLLASMMMWAERAQLLRDEATYERLTQVVLASTARGSEISQNLIAFSRPKPLVRQVFDLVDALEAAIAVALRHIEIQQVVVRREYGESPALVYGDRGQLEQVFLNLIINACHAMPEGGDLTLRTACERSPDGRRQVVVSVGDTGSGIRPEYLARVFEPFFTTKGLLGESETPGTGLGLSVSHGIITAHGGAIGVNSEVGKGTVFTIRLAGQDANLAVREEAAPEPRPAAAAGGALRVLVAEDEADLRAATVAGLTDQGFDVRVASTAAQAVALLGEGVFDLVITDVVMPQGGGVAVLQHVARMTPQPPVVVVTGKLEPHLKEHMADLGAALCLTKPITLGTLLSAVHDLLERHRTNSGA